MKINASPYNQHNKSNNQNKIGFKMRKTYLITDFDGTLKPDKMGSVHHLSNYFYDIAQFQHSLKNKLKIIISTGRNKQQAQNIENEIDYIDENYKILQICGARDKSEHPVHFPPSEKKELYPKINSIITDNGEKKYTIINDKLVYSKKYEAKKKAFLQDRYKIDLNEIADIIRTTIKEHPLLCSGVKYDKHFPSTLSLKVINDSISDYRQITKLIYNVLVKKNKSFNLYIDDKHKTISVKLNRNKQDIAKDTYAIMKVEKAKRNKDLVIVAGNEVNDMEMLNIFSYVKLPDKCKTPKNKKAAEELLRLYPEIKEEIKQLPLRIIVVGRTIKDKDYESLLKFFEINFQEQYKFVPETLTYRYNYYLKAIKSVRKAYFQKADIDINKKDI